MRENVLGLRAVLADGTVIETGTRARKSSAGYDLTRLLLAIRRAAIVIVLMLGYVYFRLAGEAYALVSIGLISFAAVAQFGPALLGGMYWKGGTRHGALAGLGAGFALWVYTLMLPSLAKSGWVAAAFLTDGPFGIALLKPEQLLGLTGLDNLTHSLFWSLLANVGAYVAVSLWRRPSAQEASQALLFVDVFERKRAAGPVFWRGRARVEDLLALVARFLGARRATRRRSNRTRRHRRPWTAHAVHAADGVSRDRARDLRRRRDTCRARRPQA